MAVTFGFSTDGMGDALAYRADAEASGSGTVRGGPRAGEPHWSVQALHRIDDACAALLARPSVVLTPAQIAAIAALITANHDALTEADQPVIEAAVRSALYDSKLSDATPDA